MLESTFQWWPKYIMSYLVTVNVVYSLEINSLFVMIKHCKSIISGADILNISTYTQSQKLSVHSISFLISWNLWIGSLGDVCVESPYEEISPSKLTLFIWCFFFNFIVAFLYQLQTYFEADIGEFGRKYTSFQDYPVTKFFFFFERYAYNYAREWTFWFESWYLWMIIILTRPV